MSYPKYIIACTRWCTSFTVVFAVHFFNSLSPLFHNLQVYELMNRLNLSSSVNASSLHNYPTLAFALDLTCDLSRASTELIPNITNTNITSVVGRLNAANLKDSCLWLNQVINSTDVNTTGSEVDCESQENITDVCKRWGSIKQFNSTLSAVHSLDPNTVNASVGCWIEGKQLSNSTAATIRRIL